MTLSRDFLLGEGDPPSKREILRCALELFVTKGLCETSIRDIARASGYTNPALYKFFDGKDGLALHLFERCYLRLVSLLRASQRRDAGFEANLESLVTAYAQLADESLAAILYVDETLRLFWPKLPAATRRHSLLSIIRDLLKRAVAEGALRHETDVDLALATMVGTMAQVARMAHFGELRPPMSSQVPGLLRLFRAALVRVSGDGE